MKFVWANLFKCFLILTCAALYNDRIIAQVPYSTTSPQSINRDSINVENIIKRSMFVKVSVSKNKIFVGEPVMVLYKFYTSVNGQAVVLKQPEFSGCSVNELNFEDEPLTENINNETYTTYVIRKVQLTPVQPGTLSIGAATVTNHVEVQGSDAFITDKYDISVSNPATSVDVIALPEKNKPDSFYGITGSFSITAAAAESKIAVNENDHLIITIKGSGNLDAVNKPSVAWPSGTEHFDGNDSQHVDQNSFPISGDRVFDIPFIGKKEGEITIPPVSFSYFNTALKNYETLRTDSIAVTFTKALSKKGNYINIVTYDISNRRYLWIIPAIAVTVALIGFIGYKRNKKQQQKNVEMQPSVTPVPVFEPAVKFKFKTDFSRHWNELQGLTDVKLFFTKAKELLVRAVLEKTESESTSEAILLAGLKTQINSTLFQKTFSLLDLCNEKMYAPFETETDLQVYFNEVKATIEQLQAES